MPNTNIMIMKRKNFTTDRLRSYSSAFSRNVFSDLSTFSDFSHLDWLYREYDQDMSEDNTYLDYLSHIYACLIRFYRCEYVYKNEIINQLLLKKYGTQHTVAFNEFKVGNSIVDLAMMNGESKAFEIKTSLDTPRRLDKQLDDYKRIFNKSYIVIDADELSYYESRIDDATGIITLSHKNGKITLKEYRKAIKRENLDTDTLMSCLRTREYQNIVVSYFGQLPAVPIYEMYDACKTLLQQIPTQELNKLYLTEVKKRRNVTAQLKDIPMELRQMILSLNLPTNKQKSLINTLNEPIKRTRLCIARI